MNRYSVVAADKAGTDWTVFQSDDPVLACRTAADHRAQPFGYWYGVWDSDRDCWVDETEHEQGG